MYYIILYEEFFICGAEINNAFEIFGENLINHVLEMDNTERIIVTDIIFRSDTQLSFPIDLVKKNKQEFLDDLLTLLPTSTISIHVSKSEIRIIETGIVV